MVDISVLIATHDRAEELRRTLDRLGRQETAGFEYEVVVVDNDSRDHTRVAVLEAAATIPVRYLFEPRPGKNCALNRALDGGGLGSLLVFIDDDIDVGSGYLASVHAFSKTYPECSVFGGRIRAVWPRADVPGWATHPSILGWGIAALDLGDEPREFPPGRLPAGGNYWVRSAIFADGRRFDERIGPRPSGRIMGSETSLLRRLRDEGHRPLYCPSAVVGHRIKAQELEPASIRRRAFWNGRARPHLRGLDHPQLLREHRFVWRCLRAFSLARHAVVAGLWFLFPSSDLRVIGSVRAIRGIAYNLEALRVEARQHAAQGKEDLARA